MLRAVTLLLVVITLLSTPGVVALLVLLMVPVVALLWLAGRFGLRGVIPFWLLRRPRRAPLSDRGEPVMVFRVDDGRRVQEIRLRGHQSGVQLGDYVKSEGIDLGGTLHAAKVTNQTTGVVLRRPGTMLMLVLVVIDILLVVTLAGRWFT